MLHTSSNGFLDRAAIRRKLGAGKLRFFLRAGSYTRQVARNSVRVRRRPKKAKVDGESIITRRRRREETRAERDARVGKPPVSRTRFFKNSIYFAFHEPSDSLIVGPVGGKNDPTPAAFEHGGQFPVVLRDRRGRTRRTRGQYRKFPTMGPALTASTNKFAEFLRGTVS